MAFTLAVGEMAASPFRIMDEFDVFMDGTPSTHHHHVLRNQQSLQKYSHIYYTRILGCYHGAPEYSKNSGDLNSRKRVPSTLQTKRATLLGLPDWSMYAFVDIATLQYSILFAPRVMKSYMVVKRFLP